MKTKRFRYSYRRNASTLHKKVGNWLREHYPNHKIYQEYPVQRVNPTWKDGRAKYDFVLLDLKIVVECHGMQHEKEVSWSGRIEKIDCRTVIQNLSLKQIQKRDADKKQAAYDAGFSYIVVWYYEQPEVLIERMAAAMEENLPTLDASSRSETIKERQRVYRHEQYLRRKAWKAKTLQ